MGLRKLLDDERCCRFAIDGELGIYTVAALKADLDALRPSRSRLEIDLSGVTDIDTAGLQWMLMAERIEGLSVHFMNPAGTVLELLEWTHLAHGTDDGLDFETQARHPGGEDTR